ncbi:uncharacterized protein K460DRAFT_75210 [Cucurbitaria berberidis CBS 394.84]|uniref:Uncharacterized protein n=1 Tax=Cucurbitaria berberidis CBS 394.84 TaxID=1168544 RepID=A0A9P4GNX1_9PLEO|nr:uncharacterized protein K460DRAFT_75210 [Cucurbitaria berberidis CBS 394.84]KAF1848471.1 hypothetical protein K460DRAFT_75210 [Cucurbitaria berberidis CBS 394.84]
MEETTSTTELSDSDNIPRLSEALADPELELVYREAKLQFESFLCDHTALGERVDLMLHYRNLFEAATHHLGEDYQLMLLHLCFGYKRQRTIVMFLDYLDEKAFTWASTLKTVVKERGRDSLFDELAAKEKELEQQVSQPQTRGQSVAERDITTEATPKKQQGPYFVIPTLCLAYPADFCTAFASQAPIERLTVPNLLACPAMLLIDFSPLTKNKLRAELLNEEKLIAEVKQRESWVSFFDHLLKGQERLLDHYFRRPALKEESAYEEEDLDMWLMKWLGNRQMSGLKEKGEQVEKGVKKRSSGRVAKRNGTTAGSDKEVQVTADAVQVEQTIGVVEDAGKRRKRVNWPADEELESSKDFH